jgi:hypothetical protein
LPAASRAIPKPKSSASPPRYVEYTRLTPFGSSLATKASRPPRNVGWKGPTVGKSFDVVVPVT